jgi:hypothetical protein
MNRTILTSAALVAGLLLTGTVWGVTTFQKMESFDSDPGWNGLNNRDGSLGDGQDYGFSNTNNAGGAAVGEAGGEIGRTGSQPQPDGTPPTGAYYADNLNGQLDFNTAFSASGKLTLPSDNVQAFLGFFDSNNICFTSLCGGGGRADSNVAGFWVDFNTVYFTTNTPTSSWNNTANLGAPTYGNVVDWDFAYDPDGDGGAGTMSGTFNGTAFGPTTLNLKASGAVFDRFGLSSSTETQLSGFQNTGPIFIDDVEYTAVPEPAVLGLLACGGLLMLRRRRA